jgi:hypothetical protein
MNSFIVTERYEWLANSFYILEVPGTILGSNAGYTN